MGKMRKGKLKSGTYILREIYMSPAFLALKGFAPQLLVLFLGKRDMDKGYNCLNPNSLTMTYAELENIHNTHSNPNKSRFAARAAGITRPRISRALDELLEKGFIKIVRKGGKAQRDKSVYGLAEDWRLWSEGVVIATREKEARTLGYINKKTKVANVSVPIHANVSVPVKTPKRAIKGNESVPIENGGFPLCGAA